MQPLSLTCSSSSCWYLEAVSRWSTELREGSLLFAFRMEIDPGNASCTLVEAYIVEAFEARTRDGFDLVIGNQEVFLPTHEEVIVLRVVLEREAWRLSLLRQWPPCGKARPVLHIDLFRGAPFWMCSFESVFVANDFSLEVGCQRRMIVSQT